MSTMRVFSHSSSGSVLLMVLITSAILYLVAATLLLLTMTEVHLSDFELRSTQALYAAESGVTLGLARLRQTPQYRTTTSDTMTVGGNPAMMTVDFQPRLFENTTSLYHLTLQGTGSVPGWQAVTMRRVHHDVVVKPFAILARDRVLITQNCRIFGNVHGNGQVNLESGSKVDGNVTSAVLVQDNNDGTIVSGKTSAHEPVLTVPELDFSHYALSYWYQGKQYLAEELVHDIVILSPAGANDPPFETLDLYSGYAPGSYDPDDPTANPAGIFYTETPLSGEHTALDLEGTLVIPPSYPEDIFSFSGPIRITPVDHFPAVISARHLDVSIQDAEELKKYTNSLKTTHIKGLIYSQGNILVTGDGTTGTVLTGSLVGSLIQLDTNLMLHVDYDTALLADPPPGIDFLELGQWREPLSE